MNRNNKIQEEVQKTMDAMDRMERLEANPWLFTRIEERLKTEATKPVAATRSFLQLIQPALVACLLLFNVWTAYNVFNSQQTDTMIVDIDMDDFSYLAIDEQTIENYIPE